MKVIAIALVAFLLTACGKSPEAESPIASANFKSESERKQTEDGMKVLEDRQKALAQAAAKYGKTDAPKK